MRAKFKVSEATLLIVMKHAGILLDETEHFDGYNQGLVKYSFIDMNFTTREMVVTGNPFTISTLIGAFASAGIDCFVAATSPNGELICY